MRVDKGIEQKQTLIIASILVAESMLDSLVNAPTSTSFVRSLLWAHEGLYCPPKRRYEAQNLSTVPPEGEA